MNQRRKQSMVDKTWYVLKAGSSYIRKTYEEAVKEAKRDAKRTGEDHIIFASIAQAVVPDPDIEIMTVA
jgi:hypothetical protein